MELLSEKWAVTEEFVNVLAGRLLAEQVAREERDYKRLEELCFLLARLCSSVARARARARAILTATEYEAAVARAFAYAEAAERR